MDYIKSKVEFLERLYFLNNTGKLIVADTDSWTKTEEMSISFNHRLMRSPLAQRIVGDLAFWIWNAARILAYYTVEADPSAFQLLQDFGDRRLKGPRWSGEVDSCASESRSLNLNELNLAARTLVEIIDDVFGRVFFDPPISLSPSPSQIRYGCDDISQYLRSVDGNLQREFYWLGEVLDDLGKVMAFDGEIAASEEDMEPSICLDQFRIRRHGPLH
jgi:hypothetical protein